MPCGGGRLTLAGPSIERSADAHQVNGDGRAGVSGGRGAADEREDWANPDQDPPAPALPKPPPWWVDRPDELADLVRAVRGRPDATVAATTDLVGLGGLGKTTLTAAVCADRRVARRFAGRIYRVMLGRGVRGPAAIAAKVNEAVELITADGRGWPTQWPPGSG